MHLGDDYTIIFNGQIYNHTELREKHGLNCATHSDTETLLHLYRKCGSGMLNELEGMFAFIIHDKKNNRLFVARDRAGKKPLYIYQKDDQVAFASELNTFRSFLPLTIQHELMPHYLRFSFFYGANTPYKEVTELRLGSYVIYDIASKKLTIKNWWKINDHYQKETSKDSLGEAKGKVKQLLTAAIKRRLDCSDLEVGAFLSGGIDSGLITAIASSFKPDLKTFTVRFPGAFDESYLAKQVAEKYGTKHTEIDIGFDNLLQDLETIILNYGEPYADSSAIPSYYVSKEAKKYLTVILNGDGADELFGGYRRYVPFSKYDFFASKGGIAALASVIRQILPHSHNKKSRLNYLYRLADLASKKNKISLYLTATFDAFEGNEDKFLVDSDWQLQELFETEFCEIINAPISGLRKMMNLDFNVLLYGDLLVKMDIATMAHSLEGRSPFLCKELLEYAPTLSDQLKIRGTTTKYLLRQLAAEYLPSSLINQPKRGFEVPLKNWIDNDIRELVFDYLTPASSYSNQFLHPSFIEKLLKKKIHISDEKRAKMLWAMLCLEIWYAGQASTNVEI